jgi:hypothetical protein
MPDMRYFDAKDKFLAYCWEVFSEYFASEGDFRAQFENIPSDAKKNTFLKLTSFYKFLVRDGKFTTKVDGEDRYEDYLDHTYKFIAIMSFIEAMSPIPYRDFYEWLNARKRRPEVFPIRTPEELAALYEQYKLVHGASRKAEDFFGSLDDRAHTFLASRISVSGSARPPSALAKLLYQVRSEFVHRARLIVEFVSGGMFSTRGGRRVYSDISFNDLALLFEDGLLHHFGFSPAARKI